MSLQPITRNTLFYGDNLPILREHLAAESVDLIYLDPPFNSNRSYNVLFKNEKGKESEAQATAFEDTWHWDKAAQTFDEVKRNAPADVEQMLNALHSFIGENQMMAYLVMMSARLLELHRVLKPTGSLYLHCDPTASHYLKIILDTIVGVENYRNEITWKRTSAHNTPNRWGGVHDVLLFYTKSNQYTWNQSYLQYEQQYLDTKYRYSDERGRYRLTDLTGAGVTRDGSSSQPWRGVNPASLGRHWGMPREVLVSIVGATRFDSMTTQEKLDVLDQNGYIYWPPKGRKGGIGFPQLKRYLSGGVPIQDVITDIAPINSMAAERLGYPTQKPVALLKRIIAASSNAGDVVLDPFCGCGTAIAAAHELGRQWLGIDITYLSIDIMKQRLAGNYQLVAGTDYDVVGEPEDLDSARQLARDNRYEFQWWALLQIGAKAYGAQAGGKKGKKGADKGVDGVITFEERGGKFQRAIVQVKSGGVNRDDIATLHSDMQREQAAVGIFLTLEPPTAPMKNEADAAGEYQSTWNDKYYPQIQIITIEDVLHGKQPDLPPTVSGPFKDARKVKGKQGEQRSLL